jgi:hypothetical protein
MVSLGFNSYDMGRAINSRDTVSERPEGSGDIGEPSFQSGLNGADNLSIGAESEPAMMAM